tara:strand:+ start:477 stop:953 length:477 start_codon:yes stop_codon:yes gene_type:complete
MADFDQFLANLLNTERDILNTDDHYLTMMFLNRIRDESRFNSFGPKKVKLRALDSIPKMQRDLMSAEDLEKCKAIGISQEIIDIEEEYKLAELKELVIKNNYPIENVVGHKGKKRTWAKALLKTSEWGFNTFVVGVNKDKKHPLNGQMDVLLMIQDLI